MWIPLGRLCRSAVCRFWMNKCIITHSNNVFIYFISVKETCLILFSATNDFATALRLFDNSCNSVRVSYLRWVHITLNINRLVFEEILYLLDEMQLPQVFKWGNCGELSRFIAVLSNSFCLVTRFFEIGCIEPASPIWSWTDAYICLSLKRFIFPLCEFSWDWQTHKHIGGLLLVGSVPLNCYVWLLALCLFITIVKPLACVPHRYKTYTKTFLKGVVRGLWCHDNSSNIIDFFPLRRPYHVLGISVARSPRRPFWLTTLGFWHRGTAQ